MSQANTSTAISKFVLPVLAAMTAIAPFAIDAYLPAFPLIAADLDVNPVMIGYSLSAYLFGVSLGQLLGGPISDQIGRRKIAICGLALFALMSVAIIFVARLDHLIIARIFQAIGGGLCAATVMPTIRDLSSPEKVASRIALVFLIMLIAPLIAPIVGVGLMQFGWRWIFGFLSIYALIILAIYWSFLKETRADRQSKVSFRKIFSQYNVVFQHKLEGSRISVRYGLASALSSCVLFVYLTNASFIFQTYFGVSDTAFPLFFGVNVIALILAQSFSAKYLRNRDLVEIASYFRFGQRLQLLAISLLVVSVIFTDISLWLFLPFMFCAIGCLGITGSAGSGLYLSFFSRHSGSASAILTTSTFLFGALLGGLSGILNQGDLRSSAGIMLLASLVANLLLLSISRKAEKSVLEKVQSGGIASV